MFLLIYVTFSVTVILDNPLQFPLSIIYNHYFKSCPGSSDLQLKVTKIWTDIDLL